MTRRQTSGASSQVVPLPPVMPALLTRMSILPCASGDAFGRGGDGGLVGQLDHVGADPAGLAERALGLGELSPSASHSATAAPEASMRSAMA